MQEGFKIQNFGPKCRPEGVPKPPIFGTDYILLATEEIVLSLYDKYIVLIN